MDITEDLLKRRSKHFDIACIQRLNLSSASLWKVSLLEGCTSLVELNLSKNQISSVRGIPSIGTLKSLDCSYNKLTSLDGLGSQSQLEELHLEGNEIKQIDFAALQKQLPRLRRLFLFSSTVPKANPVCKMDNYHDVIQRAMPSLEYLDGEVLALRHVEPTAKSTLAAEPELDLHQELAEAAWNKVSWDLPPCNPSSFVKRTTKKLQALLLECHNELHGDSLDLLNQMETAVAARQENAA
ncbi:Aste57867_9803 [Aphanomyces stellatus]|uniref:Aste57867_9803 protein n=1 Tax=Aphanomyces stellatus TaxID=120398 RepID=A0A485KPE5_9STRA|nr:hypothetical protein As57867_009764 [Aphanomyces stellatus]VFT86682.1 Aste57867_9803 [Aphanomyces stellatus]